MARFYFAINDEMNPSNRAALDFVVALSMPHKLAPRSKQHSPLTQTDDLIQSFAYLRKRAIGQRPERVGFGTAQTPVE